MTSTRAERIPGPSDADHGDSTATETTSVASPAKSSDRSVAAPLPISGPDETAADEPGTVDLGTVDLGADDLDDTAATPNDATTLPAQDASPESVPEDDIDIDIDASLATVDTATDSTSLAAQETSSGSSTSDERLDRTTVSAGVTGHKATKEGTAATKETDREGDSADDTSGDGDA